MIQNNSLNYIEFGKENNEVILFLHPKTLANWIWEEQKKDFSKFNCFYIDLPEHGNSYTNNEFTIKSASILIENFIKEILNNKKEINSVNIIGFGLGGQITIELINKNPKIINKIIISGIEFVKPEEKVNKTDSIVNILDATKKDYLDDKKDSFLAIAYLRHFDMKKSFYKDMKKTCNNISQKRLKEISYESLNYCLPENLKDNIISSNKEKDIIISYGTKEDISIQKSSVELKDMLKNTTLLEINKGVHLWNMKKPETFNEIANDFFNNNEIKDYENIKKFN